LTVGPEVSSLVGASGFASRAGYVAGYAAEIPDAVPAQQPLSVDVVFTPRLPGETPLLAAGGSGDHGVPVGQYASSEGRTAEEYVAAEQYFASQGVRVTHTWPDRLVLSLEGTPAALDRAFHTALRAGAYGGVPVVYPATPPALPPELESMVAGVVGLSTGFDSFDVSLSAPTPIKGASSDPGQVANTTITPGDARWAYGVSDLLLNVSATPRFPSSEAIALVLWGDGYDPDDISTFYANDYPSSFPSEYPNVQPYPIDGAPPPSPAALSSSDLQAVQELTLDIEWSGSIAPNATIDVVYPPTPNVVDLTDALEKALSLPDVVAVSMSFGTPEAGDAALSSAWGALFDEAASRGITVLAASGDTGGTANSSCTGGISSEYPASSPQVIAVGGTVLSAIRDPLGTITGWSETAWDDSGGGYSDQFAAPGWEKVGSAGVAIDQNGGGRGLPDVSATAAENYMYFDGQNQQADGTSFATPLWAAIVADLDAQIGSPLGFFTGRLYHVAANQTTGTVDDGLVDISSGQNCIAQAAPGWDAITGWGTPRAKELYYELVGSFVNLTIVASVATLAPGGTVTVRAESTNWTTHDGMSGLPVVLEVASDTSIGPCTGPFDSVTVTSNATGWAQANLEVPFCYLGAHAILRASVTTPRLFGTSELRVSVNLLGFVPSLASLGESPYSYLLYAGIMVAAVVGGGWLGRRRPPAAAGRGEPPPPTTPPPTPAPSGPPGSPSPRTGTPGLPSRSAPAPSPAAPGENSEKT
jgi:kumamolisin